MEMFARTVDVYLKSGPLDHTMLITPGSESDASHFHNPDGPIQFSIKFVKGKANVPAHIADYLIDKEAVELDPPKVSAIIRPQAVVAEDRIRHHRTIDTRVAGA
jgi:hypothetical protein